MKIPLNKKAIEKIWDLAVKHVLPNILTPEGTRLRGMARADVRAYEMRAIAQAEQDIEDIKNGRARFNSDGQLVPVSQLNDDSVIGILPEDSQVSQLMVGAAQTVAYLQNLERHTNLRRIFSIAEQEAKETPDEHVSDDVVDPGWFARWRDGAQDVSGEEMTLLWARVLAGEAAQPDTFSLHTVDLLRNLSRADAKLIERVAPFVINNDILRNMCTEDTLPFTDLLDLSDIGILKGVESRGLTNTITSVSEDKFENYLICNNKSILIYHKISKKDLRYESIRVTRVGQEILSLGTFEANMPYLEKFISMVKERGFTVKIGDYDRRTERVKNLLDK